MYPIAIPIQQQEIQRAPIQQTPTQQPPMPSVNIDWGKVAKVFADPRATPAFYKLALGLLVDVLSHQRAMEQLALQKQLASTKDLTPLVNVTNALENRLVKMYDLYSSMPDKKSVPAIKLATDISQLESVRDQLYGQIAKHYGMQLPKAYSMANTNNQMLPTSQPRQSSSDINVAIPKEVFTPEYTVFINPLKTVFGMFNPE